MQRDAMKSRRLTRQRMNGRGGEAGRRWQTAKGGNRQWQRGRPVPVRRLRAAQRSAAMRGTAANLRAGRMCACNGAVAREVWPCVQAVQRKRRAAGTASESPVCSMVCVQA